MNKLISKRPSFPADKASGKGTPEVMDAVYTIAGGVPVALVGLL